MTFLPEEMKQAIAEVVPVTESTSRAAVQTAVFAMITTIEVMEKRYRLNITEDDLGEIFNEVTNAVDKVLADDAVS